MSRASDDQEKAVVVVMSGVLHGAFSGHEVEQMLMHAVKHMTVAELEQLVSQNTRYDDLMDVEVAVM